jgi:YggT family protein
MSSSLAVAGTYLIQTIFGLYLLAILLRFLLQIARADFYNPVCHTIVKITNPLLQPLRRITPGLFGLDIAALILGLMVQTASICLILILHGYQLPSLLPLFGWAFIGTLSLVLNIYFFALIAVIILSWVAPHSQNPLAMLIQQLIEPVMRPVRRLMPNLGGLDLSPIVIFIAINLVKIVLLQPVAMALQIPSGLMLGL